MQTINLTQNNFKMPPVVYMVQNDTGRELKMIIQDETLLLGDTGAVAVQRSDGSYYTIPATIQIGDNAFKADISQALTQPGRTLCQLKVTRSGLVVSSYTFAIMVQPSTDGISEEQLGYSVQQLRQDAEDIRAGGMPAALRLALLQIAQKVAYIDDQGQQYYQDLYDALQPDVTLISISAVYTQSGTVYDTDTLDDLKADLVVTATYSDSSTETLPASAYTLSGTLAGGTSTITVMYEGETDTFDVTVTHNETPYQNLIDFGSTVSATTSTKITYTVNQDGSITFNATASPAYANFTFGRDTQLLPTALENGKKYRIHITFTNVSGSGAAILPAIRKIDGTSAISAADLGVSWLRTSGEIIGEWTQDNSTMAYLYIFVTENTSNNTFSGILSDMWVKEVVEG